MERVITGVCNEGKFQLIIGNDISSKFNMKLNMINQSVEYNHPQLGRQILRIMGEPAIDKLNTSSMLFEVMQTEIVNEEL